MKLEFKSIDILLALGVLCALSIPARAAENPQKVLDALRRVDSELKQGSITYDLIETSPIGPRNLHTRLDYSADGRFHEAVTGSANGIPQSYEMFFDGNDQLCVTPDPKDVQFQIPKSTGETADTLRPRISIGRGLSSLANKKVTQDATGIDFTGTSKNGILYNALLDQTHGYVAKEMISKNRKGRIIGVWHFSSPQNIGNGIYVDMKSNSDVIYGGRNHIQSEHTVEKMSTREPDPGEFSFNWLTPGFQIDDERLGSTDFGRFLSSNLPRNLTSAQLLERTRKQIACREKLYAQNEVNKKILIGIALALAVILGIVAFKFKSRFPRLRVHAKVLC